MLLKKLIFWYADTLFESDILNLLPGSHNYVLTILHAIMKQVSELLGSFGDNELSPECLDGAQRFLKPDGISIPSSY